MGGFGNCNMAKKPKTPNATPIATLAKEIVFTYVQSEHGVDKLSRIMKNAKTLGHITNPKEFRKWLITELIKSVDTIDLWLQKTIDQRPNIS